MAEGDNSNPETPAEDKSLWDRAWELGEDAVDYVSGAADHVYDAAVDTVAAVTGNETAEAFAADNRLQDIEGYNEFKAHLTEEGPIRDSLQAIMGDDFDVGDSGNVNQLMGRLEGLAAQDPAVFKNLNTILEAEGFDGFAQRVAGNENLSAVFKDLMSDGDNMTAENATAILHSFSSQIEENPDYFNTITTAMDRFPGVVDSIAGDLANNPEGAFKKMQGYMDGYEFFAGLGLDDFLGKFADFDMENFSLANIGEILLAVVNAFNGFIENGLGAIMGAFDNNRDPDMTAGNLNHGQDGPAADQPGTPAVDAAVKAEADLRDNGELSKDTNTPSTPSM